MLLESSKCGLSEDISSTCINLPYTFPMDSAVVVSSDDLSRYGSVIILHSMANALQSAKIYIIHQGFQYICNSKIHSTFRILNIINQMFGPTKSSSSIIK